MKIFIGFLIIVFGAFMTIKPLSFHRMFGDIPWAETNLRGGSIAFYRYLGMLFSLIGILIMTDLLGIILLKVLLPLFGSNA